jgi:hypothetical protein
MITHLRHARPLVLLAFVLVLLVPTAVSAAPARFFPETQHQLVAPMLPYWTTHGGLPVFGYPISEAFREPNADAGAIYLTQYLERNRFEAHPENAAPYDVLLGRLGDDRLRQLGIDWQTLPKVDSSAPHYFATSGHAIAHAPFWRYWSTHGLELGDRGVSERESLALFGLPIGEPQIETNMSGDTVLTQWFERARFEDHGAKGVLLGLLGNETTTARRAEAPFLPVGPTEPTPPSEDIHWVSQRIFEIFNEVRREQGLPPYAYRADLQPLADEAVGAWTMARQSGGDEQAVIDAYAARFTSQTPWSSWQYATVNAHLSPGHCRNIDPNDPLAGWRFSSYAKTEFRTLTIGVSAPYTGSCGSPAVSVGIIVGQ